MDTNRHNLAKPSRLLVLGHRGAIVESNVFHQNSARAFTEALTVCDGFETDACVDKDGEVFLIHEAKYFNAARGVEYCAAEHLDPASEKILGNRRIDQMTTDEMHRLRLKDGKPIPSLREAMDLTNLYTDKLLNIELKAFNVVDHVIRIAKDYMGKGRIKPENLMLSSFNHPALLSVRRELPEIQIGAIFLGDDQPPVPLFPWQPGSDGGYMPLTLESVANPLLEQIQPDYFEMPQEILTEKNIEMVAKRYPKAKLMCWVFTEKENFNQDEFLKRLGKLWSTGKIAGVMMDNPRIFVNALRDIGRSMTL
jgi:glycerophosphoryl diester phosphodiesterase